MKKLLAKLLFISGIIFTIPVSYAIEDCGTSVTECQLKQRIKDLENEVQALKALKDKVTALEALISSQPPKTENCTTAQKGQIRFDGTYARLCNGKDWQILDARQSKPVLKQSAEKYTMAEVVKTTNTNGVYVGSWPQCFGQGTICETGYHLCVYMEALVIKYAYPRSRIDVKSRGHLRTLGNFNAATLAGTNHPANSLFGANELQWDKNGVFNGPMLRCPSGSGPVIEFVIKKKRNLGAESDGGGCRKDDKRYWACCINNLD